MVTRARERRAGPAVLDYGTQSLTIFVEDVDVQFERTKASGAKIVEELHETEWGATVAKPAA